MSSSSRVAAGGKSANFQVAVFFSFPSSYFFPPFPSPGISFIRIPLHFFLPSFLPYSAFIIIFFPIPFLFLSILSLIPLLFFHLFHVSLYFYFSLALSCLFSSLLPISFQCCLQGGRPEACELPLERFPLRLLHSQNTNL